MSPSISLPRNRVFFFSHPRTASNLLKRLLSEQKGWSYTDYNFFPSYHYAQTHVNLQDPSSTSEDVWTQYSKLATAAYEDLNDYLSAAEKEHMHTLTSNHTLMLLHPNVRFTGLERQDPLHVPLSEPHTNPTIFPDSFLLTFTPLFLIRHPALVFESSQRIRCTPTFPASPLSKSFLPERKIYEWYKARNGIEPIVLDADDVIERPEIVTRLCELLGMNPSEVRREWDVIGEEDKGAMQPNQRKYTECLISSKGVLAGKSSRGLDLGKKKEEWKMQFGVETAEWLGREVEAAMEDYEFLRSVRMV